MSNRDPDDRYEVVQQGIPFFGGELLKQVHTSLPGVVVEYDAMTRRARVQPAVDLMLSPPDDPTADFGALIPMPKPIILDVPVIFPAGGGYTVHFPLVKDDPVMLLFAERDIAAFKLTLETGPPISDDVMEIQHAVCIPGFVFPNEGDVMIPPPTIPPGAFPDWLYGVTIQTNDGLTYVHLAAEPNEIHARIVGDPVDETTYVRITPQRIYATPDNAITSVSIRPGDILATPDNDVTHARLRPADVDVTPDSGATLLRVTGGNVAITATTVTITGALNVTGASTLVGNVAVTGNIGVSGTVDGVDVSTHDHTFGTQTDGTTGPPN